MNKRELLETMRAERERWEGTLAEVDPARLEEPGVEGIWSVKDLVAHMIGWERWAGGQLAARTRGRRSTAVELYGRPKPPEIEQWRDFDRFNAWTVEGFHDRTPADVLAESRAVFARLLATVEACPERDLTDRRSQYPGFEWNEGEPMAEAVAELSYRHWRLHAPSVRAWLDRRGATH